METCFSRFARNQKSKEIKQNNKMHVSKINEWKDWKMITEIDLRMESFLLKIYDLRDYVNYVFEALDYRVKNNKKLQPFQYGNLIESHKENIERQNTIVDAINTNLCNHKFFNSYKTEFFTIIQECKRKIESSSTMLKFFEDCLIEKSAKSAKLVYFYRVELDELKTLNTKH